MTSKKIYGFKGKYCSLCNSVWEVITATGGEMGMEVKYPGFPSYGLEREQCSSCKEPPKSFKGLPSTLAQERHKKLLQRISTDNQELLKRNVKKQGK